MVDTPMTPTSPQSTLNPTIFTSTASPEIKKQVCVTSQILFLNQEKQI